MSSSSDFLSFTDLLSGPLYDIPGASRSPRPKETYAEREVRLMAVVEWVRTQPTGSKVSILGLSRMYDLPYTLLLARINGRPPKGQYRTNCWLSEEQDQALCQYLARLDKIGTSPTHSTIRHSVNEILRLAYEGDGPPPVVSEKWPGRWLRDQHPEFTRVKQYSMEIERTVAESIEIITKWLKKYKQICEEFGILPEDQWNGDESGFRVGMGKDEFVYTLLRDLKSTLPSASCRELVTVIECISGAGIVLPPMIILPGSVHLRAWYDATGIDDDYLVAVSESGYSHDEYGLEWIKHVEKFSRLHQKGEYR